MIYYIAYYPSPADMNPSICACGSRAEMLAKVVSLKSMGAEILIVWTEKE